MSNTEQAETSASEGKIHFLPDTSNICSELVDYLPATGTSCLVSSSAVHIMCPVSLFSFLSLSINSMNTTKDELHAHKLFSSFF